MLLRLRLKRFKKEKIYYRNKTILSIVKNKDMPYNIICKLHYLTSSDDTEEFLNENLNSGEISEDHG